ncbi:MAG: hypothetical protein IPI91_15700 [Flavobacteriales bacterium]|nr:hypothetical protein [Flavobacteriales bacterium]
MLRDTQGQVVDVRRIPVRLAYPTTDLGLNAANKMAVGHGINDLHTMVW